MKFRKRLTQLDMNDRKTGFGLAHDGECGLLLFGGEVLRQRHGEQAAVEPAAVMGLLRGEGRAFGRRIRREAGESLRHPGKGGSPFGACRGWPS